LTPADLGDRAAILPGSEPEVRPSPTRKSALPAGKQSFIPVCEPLLDGNESRYVAQAIASNWVSSAGPYVKEFEQEFSRACAASFGVACSSGTAALHLALAAHGIGAGDEVIVPTFTMVATANAVKYTGATPVFVDSEPDTWNLDLDAVEAKISRRTRAIIPVHTYGHPVDMDRLTALASAHSIRIIEDAAEAHGARYKGRPVGSLGDSACFSFYANKIITTGEGGMVLTNDPKVAALARNLRDHAFSQVRHFWHQRLGFNYRMTNLQAAVGLAQTERLKDLVALRRANAALYRRLLMDVPGLSLPPEADWASSVFWMYGILVEDSFGVSRDELREYMADRGIETRTFFVPMHLQPIYYEEYGSEAYPVAEELCRKGMYLPSGPNLPASEVEYVALTLKEAAALAN
jgi:perosamine synthetase